MNELSNIITILEQELIALGNIKKRALEEQILLIKTKGDEIGETAKLIEGDIMHLNTLETQKLVILKNLKISNIKELAYKLPLQNRSVILELNTKIERIISELQEINTHSKVLLDKNIEFLDYNINILTSVVSSPTYITEPQSPIEPIRQKIFDQKI